MAKAKPQPDFGKVNVMSTTRQYNELPLELVEAVRNMVRINMDAGEQGRNDLVDGHNAGWVLWNSVMAKSFSAWGDVSPIDYATTGVIQIAMKMVGDVPYTVEGYVYNDAVGQRDELRETAEHVGSAIARLQNVQHDLEQGYILMETIRRALELRMVQVRAAQRAYEQIAEMVTKVAESTNKADENYIKTMEMYSNYEKKSHEQWQATEVLEKRRNSMGEWHNIASCKLEEFINESVAIATSEREYYFTKVEQLTQQRNQAMMEWAQQQIEEQKAKEEAKRQRAAERKASRLAEKQQ